MTLKQSAKKFKWELELNNSKNSDLLSPPGYNPSVLVNQTEVVRDQRLVIKKSWDLALGPLKQAMFSTSVTSKMAENAQGSGQKLVYFLGNLANVASALYKGHSMGLLPTHASDWLAFVELQMRPEYYGGGVSFVYDK